MTLSQPVPSSPDAQFAAWQQQIEERLRALETAPQAPYTSLPDEDGNEAIRLSAENGLEFFNPDGTRRSRFNGRALAFYAPTGESIVIIGEITWFDIDTDRVEQGIIVQRTDGKDMLAIGANGRGLLSPVMTYQPRRLNEFITVTSGVFTPVWQFIVPSIPSNSIQVRVVVGCDVGTTGEVRLSIAGVGTTATIPCASGTTTDTTFKWDTEEIGLDISSQFFVNVEARRASGAGNVAVHMPYPLRTWDDLNHGADTDGIYP